MDRNLFSRGILHFSAQSPRFPTSRTVRALSSSIHSEKVVPFRCCKLAFQSLRVIRKACADATASEHDVVGISAGLGYGYSIEYGCWKALAMRTILTV
jgi:hypothetical protein